VKWRCYVNCLKTVSISLHGISWNLDFLLRGLVPSRRSCRRLPGSRWKVAGAERRLVTLVALGGMADHRSCGGGRRLGQAVFSSDGSMSEIGDITSFTLAELQKMDERLIGIRLDFRIGGPVSSLQYVPDSSVDGRYWLRLSALDHPYV